MPRILIIAGGIFACVGLARKAMPARGTVLRLEPRRGNNAATYASGESPAERQRNEDARLRRECRGRPNAGACLGYTR